MTVTLESLIAAGTVTGSTLAGDLDADGNAITGLADPTNAQDAATRAYVLANAGGSISVTDGSTTVDPATSISVTGATLTDAGSGVADLAIAGGGLVCYKVPVVYSTLVFDVNGYALLETEVELGVGDIILDAKPHVTQVFDDTGAFGRFEVQLAGGLTDPTNDPLSRYLTAFGSGSDWGQGTPADDLTLDDGGSFSGSSPGPTTPQGATRFQTSRFPTVVVQAVELQILFTGAGDGTTGLMDVYIWVIPAAAVVTTEPYNHEYPP